MSIADKLAQIAENEQKVFDAGRQAEYNEFWDEFSGYMYMPYLYAGTGWTKNNFKPIKSFYVDDHTFFRHGWNRPGAYDLAEHLENLGVSILGMTSCKCSFQYCTMFTRLPVLDTTKANYWDRPFDGMTNLVTIDKLIINTDTITTWYGGSSFTNCTKLKNLIAEGTLGKSINFSSCPLSVESLKSIISCLKDYSTQTPFTNTLTLKDSCKTALEADTETVELDGVSYTYFELITAKGWNLA